MLALTLSSYSFKTFGVRETLRVGGPMFPMGAAVLLLLTPQSSPVLASAGSLGIGIGMGLISTTSIIVVQESVERSMRGSATSSIIFSRSLGNALGATVIGAVLALGIRRRDTGCGRCCYVAAEDIALPDTPVPASAAPIAVPAGHAGVQSFFFRPTAPRKPRIARAEGIWFWDTEGRRYMDASSGPVASNLGHGNPRVLDAMMRQARDAAFAFPMQFESEANAALAERLARLAGPGLERAFLVSGGSEAIESALRFARQHAVVAGQGSRWKVVSRQPSYHGNTAGALAVTGDKAAHRLMGPMLRDMPKVPAPFSYRVPDNHTAESWARECAAALERTILAEGPETVLAFLMEPVGGLATGALVAPDAYYTAVRDICSRHGVLLIFDEVMSGAGRTGRFLAADHWPDARPDLVVLAKGISAGYAPMGALLAPAVMADRLVEAGGFAMGFTYFANPLSCAVGVAVLDELTGVHTGRDLIANAAAMGARLRAHLAAIESRSAILGDVRGKGLLLAVELVADKGTRRPVALDRMVPYRMQEIGLRHELALYCRRTGGGEYGDWIMLTPPLTVTPEEMDLLAERFAATLAELEAELRREGAIA